MYSVLPHCPSSPQPFQSHWDSVRLSPTSTGAHKLVITLAAAHKCHRRKPDWCRGVVPWGQQQLQTKAWRAAASWQPRPNFRRIKRDLQMTRVLCEAWPVAMLHRTCSICRVYPPIAAPSTQGTVYAARLKTRFLKRSSSLFPHAVPKRLQRAAHNTRGEISCADWMRSFPRNVRTTLCTFSWVETFLSTGRTRISA